jgi:hypothetical protein
MCSVPGLARKPPRPEVNWGLSNPESAHPPVRRGLWHSATRRPCVVIDERPRGRSSLFWEMLSNIRNCLPQTGPFKREPVRPAGCHAYACVGMAAEWEKHVHASVDMAPRIGAVCPSCNGGVNVTTLETEGLGEPGRERVWILRGYNRMKVEADCVTPAKGPPKRDLPRLGTQSRGPQPPRRQWIPAFAGMTRGRQPATRHYFVGCSQGDGRAQRRRQSGSVWQVREAVSG